MVSDSGLLFLVTLYIDLNHVVASDAANDDGRNYVTHRIFNTNLQYYCAHFILKITENVAAVSF